MRPLPITCLAFPLLLVAAVAQDPRPAQGVRGALRRPGGGGRGARLPVRRVVALIAQLRARSRGETVPPLARARADENGRFELPVAGTPPPERCEIRVVADGLPTLEVAPFALRAGRWTDAGLRHLEAGHTVVGKVTAAADGAPVAGATVRIERVREKPQNAPTPGREHSGGPVASS